jgi:hypothetical protein
MYYIPSVLVSICTLLLVLYYWVYRQKMARPEFDDALWLLLSLLILSLTAILGLIVYLFEG